MTDARNAAAAPCCCCNCGGFVDGSSFLCLVARMGCDGMGVGSVAGGHGVFCRCAADAASIQSTTLLLLESVVMVSFVLSWFWFCGLSGTCLAGGRKFDLFFLLEWVVTVLVVVVADFAFAPVLVLHVPLAMHALARAREGWMEAEVFFVLVLPLPCVASVAVAQARLVAAF